MSKYIGFAIVSASMFISSCKERNFSDSSVKNSTPSTTDIATIKIESTSVSKLARVIGIEENEGACVGGNPKHVFDVTPGEELVFKMPISVQRIGLCGQARPDGMDFKHLDVSLNKDSVYVIRDDELQLEDTPIKSGFARIHIESTSVKQLTKVIGIEKEEAACVGGTPKFSFDIQSNSPRTIDFPISVKKIGLCGQARPDGMDFEHLEVSLKDGATYIVQDDKVAEK